MGNIYYIDIETFMPTKFAGFGEFRFSQKKIFFNDKNVSGFLSGVSVSRFGESKCMFLGSLLASVGLACSFLATSIPFLVASIGIFAGES